LHFGFHLPIHNSWYLDPRRELPLAPSQSGVNFWLSSASKDIESQEICLPSSLKVADLDLWLRKQLGIASDNFLDVLAGNVFEEDSVLLKPDEAVSDEDTTVYGDLTMEEVAAMHGTTLGIIAYTADGAERLSSDALNNKYSRIKELAKKEKNQDISDTLLLLEYACQRLFRDNIENFYDIFSQDDESKVLDFAKMLNTLLTAILDDYHTSDLRSVKNFIDNMWSRSIKDMDSTEGEINVLLDFVNNHFENEILEVFLKDVDRAEEHIKRALTANIIRFLYDKKGVDGKLIYNLEDPDKIFDSLYTELKIITTMSNAPRFGPLYSLSVLGCLTQVTSFAPRKFQFGRTLSGISGADLEIYLFLTLSPRQILAQYRQGFKLDLKEFTKLNDISSKVVKEVLFGPAQYIHYQERSHFDLGRDFFTSFEEDIVVLSYYITKNSQEYKPSKLKDVNLDVMRAIYDSLNSIVERCIPNVRRDLSMRNTIIEIILNSPIFNKEDAFNQLDSFSKNYLEKFFIVEFLGESNWQKFSIADDHKYNKINEINRKIGISDHPNLDEYWHRFKDEYGSSTDDFIRSLISSKTLFSKYYGSYYKSSGDLVYGLCLSGSMQNYLQSNEKVYLEDIETFVETTEGLQLEAEGQKQYLIGSYASAFKIISRDGKKIPIYRLVKLDAFGNILAKDLSPEWQLGHAIPKADGTFIIMPSVLFTDLDGSRLYSRFNGFSTNEEGLVILKDNGEDWYMDSDLLSHNSIKEYDGISGFSVRITNFGNTYRVGGVRVKLTTMNFKFGIELDYVKRRFNYLKTAQRSRTFKLTAEPFLNYYRISEEIQQQASNNLEDIFSLVAQVIDTYMLPQELRVSSVTLSFLNAYLSSGILKLGLDKSGIKELFNRLLGGLSKIDYSDPDNLLYRLCFVDVRHPGDSFTINTLGIRRQKMNDWFRVALELISKYNPTGTDRVDKLIRASGIDSNSKFSAAYDSNPTDADIKLSEILTQLIVDLFGRFTYIAMINGMLFVKDGNVNFVCHPYSSFVKHAAEIGITLLHKNIPKSDLSHLERFDNVYRAYSIMLDLFTLGPQIIYYTGSDKKTDFEIFSTPHIPMELWMPMYKEASEVDPAQLDDFYSLISSIAGSKMIAGFPNVEYELKLRAPGNMKLFLALYSAYESLIEADDSLSQHQKTMYKFMAIEKVNFFIFASRSSKDVNLRGKIKNFFESDGLNPFTLSLGFIRSYPTKYRTIDLNKPFFDMIIHMFGESSIAEIIESLDPLRVNPGTLDTAHKTAYSGVIEYYSKNILRAQRDPIIKFGNFLKDLATDVYQGERIFIQPLNTYANGLAYQVRKDPNNPGYYYYLPFFPDPENAVADQTFILEGTNLRGFRDSFIKILGGLLVDHQTYVIYKLKADGKKEGICAFNLLAGALSLDADNPQGLALYVSRPARTGYISAPAIESFNGKIYDEDEEVNILDVMNSFYTSGALIGYQRIGDKIEEFNTWVEICNSLAFINDFF